MFSRSNQVSRLWKFVYVIEISVGNVEEGTGSDYLSSHRLFPPGKAQKWADTISNEVQNTLSDQNRPISPGSLPMIKILDLPLIDLF